MNENIQILLLAAFVVIVSILIIFLIFKTFHDVIRGVLNLYFRHELSLLFLNKKLKPKYREILIGYCQFYHRLSNKKKLIFEKRVQKFIDNKEFVARGDLSEVTDEMRVLISSSAIQITFGLPGIYLEHFNRILIYADDYYSTIFNRYHKGEVNSKRGIIILSWKSFLEGNADRTDGINLGLHELAHAIHFEDAVRNNEYNFLDYDSWIRWESEVGWELQRNEDGSPPFFRKYAYTNRHEFFACAIEHFFERPQEFLEQKPKLYKLLSRLINLDPLAL